MVRSFWDWPFGRRAAGWSASPGGLRSSIDRLFDDFARDFPLLGSRFTVDFPAINLSEEEDRFVIEAVLPGVPMEDLELICQGQTLTLRGERKDALEGADAYVRRERPIGTFVRTITLPADVDADKVEATFEDGILRVLVPKGGEARPRRIDVKKTETEPKRLEAPQVKEATS